jgi:hypothetical protein
VKDFSTLSQSRFEIVVEVFVGRVLTYAWCQFIMSARIHSCKNYV